MRPADARAVDPRLADARPADVRRAPDRPSVDAQQRPADADSAPPALPVPIASFTF